MSSAISDAEAERLSALESYDVLDSNPETAFDDIVALASQICGAPVSLISLVDRDRQWFKAKVGFEPTETPLSQSVCALAIGQREFFQITDLAADERTRHNTLVTDDPHIRFYAGAVLETPAGEALGSLCVIDGKPRPEGLSLAQVSALQALGRQVMAQLELRRTARAEAVLRRSIEEGQLRFEAIFNSAIDYAIVVTDRHGRITEWNEGATRILNWSPEEAIGQDIDLFFTPEDRAEGISRKEMTVAAIDGAGIDERWHMRKSGERFWANGEMMPLRSRDGALEGFVKVLRDRTEARIAEERLRASEKRWRELFENMREGFFVGELIRDEQGLSHDYRFIEINDAFAEQSGLPASSVGQTIRSYAGAVDQGLIDRFAQTVETGEPLTFEIHVPELHRWFEVRSSKDSGERFFCLFLDITDRKTIEQELAINDERLQMALAASGAVGLWDWMVDSDLLHGDANFARLYGLDVQKTAAGLTMEEYQEFVVPDDLAPLREQIRAVFEDHADFLAEYRLDIPGSPLRWVECRGQLVLNASGLPVRFSGTAVDITERNMAEQQRHLLMQELSHRVKNTFAMVQAVAFQTLRGTDPLVSDALQNRLAALSRAHEVLVQTSWTSTTLLGLMEQVLRLEAEGDRFDLDGPDLAIGSKAALSLSLLLHELSTNAVKYGALSKDGGRVGVQWNTDGQDFRLSWRETGGPPAVAPTRRGFGSRLIEMGICGARKANLRYGGNGFAADFAADVARLLDE
jgi:PAS domain S-box-containing protein